MIKEPPLVLVRTWYELLSNADDETSKQHAKRCYLGHLRHLKQLLLTLKNIIFFNYKI